MKKIYKTEVKALGEQANDFLNENMIILFEENAPSELAEISVIHRPEFKNGELKVNDILKINDDKYKILAVGDEVEKNLINLGHCTLRFNGNEEANLPGDVNLEKKEIDKIEKGYILEILRED